MYTDFALVYDRLMRDVDYSSWAAFYQNLLSAQNVPQGASVAECACGTGNLTLPLCSSYRMHGVDLSEEMLSVAAAKARQQGLMVPFIRQDMQRLKLHKPMAAVLCTCDGINYLPSLAEVGLFFRAAYEALKPGGVLAFDFSTVYKLEYLRGNRTLTLSEEDISYIWQNNWDKAKRCVEMQLDIFTRRKDGAYDRILEEQVQQAYIAADLHDLLLKTGFTKVIEYGDCREEISEREPRLHMVAVKEGVL